MGALFLYASFPNSRIKPRPATTVATTYHTVAPVLGSPLVLAAAASLNRTYVMIKNLDAAVQLIYIYAITQVVDPSAVAVNGLTDELLYNPNTHVLYQKQDDGTTTNWSIVLPQNVGEVVDPGETASLESPQDLYVLANSGGTTVTVGVDVGLG